MISRGLTANLRSEDNKPLDPPVAILLGDQLGLEWFKQKTSIAGVQVSNWMIVLGAIIIVLLIFQNLHEAGLERLRRASSPVSSNVRFTPKADIAVCRRH